MTPVGDGRWDVTTRSTGGGVVAHPAVRGRGGGQRAQLVAAPPGRSRATFRGQLIHASAYKDPAQLRNRKVLVVGGGNTGCDIAVEAAQHAATVWHSTRRGYWYAPKYVFGRPADQVNAGMLQLAAAAAAAAVALPPHASRLTVGDVTRYGLPAPDHRPYESHPIVNSQLVYYLGHGRIIPVPDVARLRRRVRWSWPTAGAIEPDLVITATGYRPRFEFLAPDLLDTDDDGRPDLHLHAFARRHPTLAVVGLIQADAGLFPLAHWQSVAVARWLRLRVADPVRAAAVQQKESTRPIRVWARRRVVPTSRHWFEVGHTGYLRRPATEPADHDDWSRRACRQMSEILRFDDWTSPVPPVEREVLSARCPTPARTGRRCCSCRGRARRRGRSPSTGWGTPRRVASRPTR